MDTLAFQILFNQSTGLQGNQSTGLQATQLPSGQVQLSVGSGSTTLFANLPPFLLSNQGFYLGQVVQPQISIDGNLRYLEATSNQNIYTLTTEPSSGNFAIQFLSLNLFWFQPIPFNSTIDETSLSSNNIQLINFLPESQASTITFQKRSSTSNVLVYSPSACAQNNNALICGSQVCPEDFVSNSTGLCVDQSETLGRIAFGLRYINDNGQTIVVSYDLEPNGEIVFIYPTLDKLTVNQSDPFGVRERWFFIDLPGDTLEPNTPYPIYVTLNSGDKFYLTFPMTNSNGTQVGVLDGAQFGVLDGAQFGVLDGILDGIQVVDQTTNEILTVPSINPISSSVTRYGTVSDSTNQVLVFMTPNSGNFNEFIFSQSNFLIGSVQGVQFPNLTNSTIALWKGIP